jgi:uncharacterized membrane protein YcaP (DUF421 family)
LRVFIIYTIAIIVLRLMGKRQIGEMEPFELVITLIIADLATIPIADPTIPIWYGALPLFLIAVLHYFVAKWQSSCPAVRTIIGGNAAIVVTPEGVNYEMLKTLNMCYDELLEMLRNKSVFDIKEVQYAIIEQNGKLTVIPKGTDATKCGLEQCIGLKQAVNAPSKQTLKGGNKK